MDRTSISLLGRLQTQPIAADWTRLVELYRPFIARFIRLDPALAHDAEDICQEVLKNLVEHLPSFQRQRDGSFRAWLKVITINEVNAFWRRRQRRGGSPPDASFLIAGLQDPNNELSQRWDQEHGAYVLAQLQEQIQGEFSIVTWEAFRLRVYEERSTADVAAALGITKNAVDIAKSRVLNRLRSEAAGLCDD
jgi:RNA polymerase sigma-70 factor (ECF subfamily)